MSISAMTLYQQYILRGYLIGLANLAESYAKFAVLPFVELEES